MRGKGLLETMPLFEVRDESAQTCGVYDSDQAPAVAARTFAGYTSVYSAVGNWPAALYRELARSAAIPRLARPLLQGVGLLQRREHPGFTLAQPLDGDRVLAR
jgi:hypothetical protein